LGATALLAMLQRIANPAAPSREFLLDFQLVVRKSTDPNAGAQSETRTADHNGGGSSTDTASPSADELPASDRARLQPAQMRNS
jgi:hypothetical protein